MAKVAAAKKVPLFVIGAGGASLTNEDCTAYTVHYVYDTTALANGTATAIVNGGGKTWFYLTADYAFGTQLQNAASKVVEANGGKNVGGYECRSVQRIFPPSCCRRRLPARRCWAWRMPAPISPIRSRPPTNSGSRGR